MTEAIEDFRPIGHLESCFRSKNGTPRQATVCTNAKAKLTILKSVFTKPAHALDGLNEFSHVWLLFLFHKNKSNQTKAKVSPPRLDGKRVGVFSTRSPHRPNAIGLTLAQLDKIEDDTLYFTGVDILDGTPILDIKPYIPQYDCPRDPSWLQMQNSCEKVSDVGESSSAAKPADETSEREGIEKVTIRTPDWISLPPIRHLNVRFTPTAEEQLNRFSADNADPQFRLSFFTDVPQVRKAIDDILSNDPRSVYRRNQCRDRMYYFTVDNIDITCWFDDEEQIVEIVKIKPC